ncbi:MAG: metallophosphoesterase family protein [Deltaproteobacteria bacterium]|nr:metallophosphoesterase family protein [Deltaproteobacteria bacterium]
MSCTTLRLIALSVAALLPLPALAAPRHIHVSWSHPDTSTTATVTWVSDSMGDPNLIQYGIAAPGQFELPAQLVQGNPGLGALHVAELSDLKADTEYQYRVGGPGGWSDTYKFRTGPDDLCSSFRFAAFGDNRPDMDWVPQFHWNPILAETVEAAPAFLLHTGDIVKDGKDTNQWNTFFENSHPYLAEIPLMACPGNHDDGPAPGDGANYNQLFAFPRNSYGSTEDFYYFTYGDAIFVSLSTISYEGGNPPFSDQAAWLDQVLTDNPRKWKFVFLHPPPYTSHAKFDLIWTQVEFNHPPNENQQNEALVPVFDKHHVDIVFAGHNHYYERLGPMVGGPKPDQGVPVGGFALGTVYVITGGAGAMVYDEFDILGINIDLISWVCGAAAGSEVCSGSHHYVTVDVGDNVAHYEAWATAEQTLGNDPANHKLLDSFDIVKGTPECGQPPVEPEVEPSPEPFPDQAPDVISSPDSEPDVPALPDGGLPPDLDDKEGLMPPPEIVPAEDGVPSVDTTKPPADTGSAPTAPNVNSACGCRVQALAPPSTGPSLLLLLVALGWLAARRIRWPN